MEKKSGGFVKAVLSISGALLALAGAVAVLYKVLRKHLTFKIELHDEHEVLEEEVVETKKVDEKKEEEEIEISFIDETEQLD